MTKHVLPSLVLGLFQSAATIAGPLVTERINVNPTTSAQADGPSSSPVLSADGCVVAFVSQSSALAPASFGLTTSSPAQVYAVNRCVTPHTLELISVTNDGTAAADRACSLPNISADGRYVAFATTAGNLPVPGSAPSGQYAWVFVRDRVTQTTLSLLGEWRSTAVTAHNGQVSVDSDPIIYMSADASRFVVNAWAGGALQQNYYVVNFSGGASTLQPICATFDNTCLAGINGYLSISPDGSTVLVDSTYPLVAGGGSGSGFYNLYSYNVATAAFTLVNTSANGTPANASVEPLSDIDLSSDGHFVAFNSDLATNFPGNTSNTLQLKNMTTGAVTLISAMSDGTPVRISYGIALPRLSADGNRLAFTAENQLVPHNNQVGYDAVVADLSLGRLGSACISASGSVGRLGCDGTTISADGKWAAFRSTSDNLVPNDTNTLPDIFVVALDPAMDVVFASGFEP